VKGTTDTTGSTSVIASNLTSDYSGNILTNRTVSSVLDSYNW